MKRSTLRPSPQVLIASLILMFVVLSSGLRAASANVVVIPLLGNDSSSIPPANVRDLGTTSIPTNTTVDVVSVTPSGTGGGAYTVPAGKYLVITSVQIFPQSPGAGTLQLQLIQNFAARKYWVVPNSQPTQLSFGPGILIAPNYSLTFRNFSTSAGSVRVAIHGYEINQ